MNNVNKILFLVISLIVFNTVSVFCSLRSSRVNVVYEGEIVKGLKVYMLYGKEYFCIRELSKVYDTQMAWHPVTGKVTLEKYNHRLDIFIKSTRIHFDGTKKRLGISTVQKSGKVLIPTEIVSTPYFSEFTKSISLWNSGTRVLTVEKKINVFTPRFYSRPDSTKVVIEMIEKLRYKCSSPSERVFNILFYHGQINSEEIKVDDGIIKNIEISKEGRYGLIKFYLTSNAGEIEEKYLSNPPRIVINIPYVQTAKDSNIAEADDTPSIEEISSANFPPVENNLDVKDETKKEDMQDFSSLSSMTKPSEPSERRKKIIVLDPGHGGDDPGAIGRNGTKEKDINLLIVKELEKLFCECGEYEVILTRSDDRFIPLVERTNLANEKKADLFVSVHCNASLKKTSEGFEIYFLSEKASDSDAAATAVLENSVIRLEDKPTRKQAKLQKLLWSLLVNEFINESSELCSLITKEVTKRTRIVNRGVKQAGFYVLSGAQMPAVLVECAFISNVREEAKLKSRSFQRKISDAIFDGVKNYELRKEKKKDKNIVNAK